MRGEPGLTWTNESGEHWTCRGETGHRPHQVSSQTLLSPQTGGQLVLLLPGHVHHHLGLEDGLGEGGEVVVGLAVSHVTDPHVLTSLRHQLSVRGQRSRSKISSEILSCNKIGKF